MNKKRLLTILISVLILMSLFSLFRFFLYRENETDNDFTIKVKGNDYNVIVGKPQKKFKAYPLVIYHHGGKYRMFKSFELRKLAQIFAEEGFLFWAPERTSWTPPRVLKTLKEAQAMSKVILDLATKHTAVDESNINVVGFSLGSWVVFENDAKSPYVRTASLLGFGAPYDVLYDYVANLVNNTDYSKISAEILIMVSERNRRVDIEVGETVRKKMVEANKTIDCVEYSIETPLSLAGSKNYITDLVRYLKGQKINTSDSIKVDEAFKKKWESIRKTGYW